MAERSFRGLLLCLALLGTGIDQVTKYGVFKWLYTDIPDGRGEYQIIPGAFQFLAQFSNKTESATGLLNSLQTWSGRQLPRVNPGALFGLGPKELHRLFPTLNEDSAPTVANSFFIVISIVAALAIIIWGRRVSASRDWPLSAALGLILAGTVGNLYDRIIFHGVRDFLYFYWFEWPVFNVADCCLVCGAFLLLLQAFFMKPAAQSRKTATASSLSAA